MHTKMFKLELFSVLIVLLLNISCSFAGAIPNKTPTSIGNYEYPKGVYIPSNFTIPDGNVFKFKLYLAGFVWKRCNGTSGQWVGDQYRSVYFNREEDIHLYPYSAVAMLDSRGPYYFTFIFTPFHRQIIHRQVHFTDSSFHRSSFHRQVFILKSTLTLTLILP
ncbi:hypothetical protein C2G38_892656 [Gigaspora rosea]|uniref:Uncharacterized protein n=1 Tax=Gigaspora rosea TaxID=44941 RepID=A0A397VVY1_9GLOM|nr:hypothetical protein C2G38_892656 [Gigaspora rosea]